MHFNTQVDRTEGGVLICSTHIKQGYSGGRYYSWAIGVALATVGHEVTVWTNVMPQYASDWKDSPVDDRLHVHHDPYFMHPPEGDFSWVIMVPDLSCPTLLFQRWLLRAARADALVSMINFESPNYFNTFSPEKRDPERWQGWVEFSKYSDGIFSLTHHGSTYARDYYKYAPSHCVFSGCEPCINSHTSDTISVEERENQIFIITRFSEMDAAHKGGDVLLQVIGEEMRGYTLAILVGKNGIPEKVRSMLESKTDEHGVKIRLLEGLSDEYKFREIKRSKLMLFFSKFEGFGYPPVEALYCETPCIASDLPVLREVSGEGLHYVNSSSIEETRSAIGALLASTSNDSLSLKQHVEGIATVESLGRRLQDLYDQQQSTGKKAIRRFPQAEVSKAIRRYNVWFLLRRCRGRLMKPVRKVFPRKTCGLS